MNDGLSDSQRLELLISKRVLDEGFNELRKRMDSLSEIVGKLHSDLHDFRESFRDDQSALDARITVLESRFDTWGKLATPAIEQVRKNSTALQGLVWQAGVMWVLVGGAVAVVLVAFMNGAVRFVFK